MKPIANGLIIVLAVIVCVVVYTSNLGSQEVFYETPASKEIPIGELTDGMEVIQSFEVKNQSLSAVAVKLATYMRVNEGKITISVRRSANGTDIYSKTVDASNIVDNDFFILRFPPVRYFKSERYYLSIKSEGAGLGKGITAYKTPEDLYQYGEMWINGEPQAGDLVIKVYTYEPWYVKIRNLFT